MDLTPDNFSLKSAAACLNKVASKDVYKLKRTLTTIAERTQQNLPADKEITRFCTHLNRSIKAVETARANTPIIKTRGDLPISARWDEIKALIKDNQVSIVCGHTGSGKTTKLPQICLELGLGSRGRIAHTQPRRIAARTVANRIAEEVGCAIGQQIGYKVRFEEKQSALTQVLLLTDGMLLAEIQQDKFLNQYEVIIIDEAHERSLNIDFLLGYLSKIKDKRPDLKIIITSATIDPEKFAKHFDNAPILTVLGKTYPIETLYRPIIDSNNSSNNDSDNTDLHDAICQAVLELDQYHYGDTLVFLPTERDIRDAGESLNKLGLANTEVLSLFARQSSQLQNVIFHPKNKRRIILATNVAETSVTVPRILNVIDSGLARISRYSHRSKIQRLPIEAISQASAEQRKGRCGRIANGVCIRLYDEADFNSRETFTDPEIKRTNLASVILQMSALGIGQIDQFPFVEPPEYKLISDGYKLLFELLAVDDKRRITRLGRDMARLPIDPRFARILLYAKQTYQLEHSLPIVAALAIGDFRERPYQLENKADEKHRLFADKDSDFIFYLNVFNAFYPLFLQSKNKTMRLAKAHYFSPLRLREWFYLIEQLTELLEFQIPVIKAEQADIAMLTETLTETPIKKHPKHPAYEPIHTALLTGFLDYIGQLQPESKEYLGVRNKRFYIFPGSFVFKKTPKQIVCAEIVESSRVYARQVAGIDFSWLVDISKHLCKTEETEPHWLKSRGNVMAKQTVLLYGLPILTNHLVELAKTDVATAHDIFVRHALVENQIHTQVKAIGKNRASYDKLLKLEEKTRSRDILIDENRFAELYFAVLDNNVFSTHSLEKWFKNADANTQQALYFSEQQLLLNPEQTVDTSDYPNALVIRGQRYALDYEFDPASPKDGVSIHLPLSNLNGFSTIDFDYLVPALLPEKIEAIIRSLPKRHRRQFVPIPPYVEKIAYHLQANPKLTTEKPLLNVICQQLSKHSGLTLNEADFALDKIDAHFHMNLIIVDECGKTIAESRDLLALQQQFNQQASQQFSSLTSQVFKQTYHDEFPSDIAKTYLIKDKNLSTYPALVAINTGDNTGDNVGFKIELFDQAELARKAHFTGVLAFYKHRLSKEIRYIKKNLQQYQKLSLLYRSLGEETSLLDDIVDAVVANTCFTKGVPRTAVAYQLAEYHAKQQLFTNAQAIAKDLLSILQNVQTIRHDLPTNSEYGKDISQQLSRLIYPGFIANTDAKRLVDLVRYSNAIIVRLNKAKHAPQKDASWQAQLMPFLKKLAGLIGEAKIDNSLDECVQAFAYLIEEYRISLFAQAEVKISGKVSEKRLNEAFEKIK